MQTKKLYIKTFGCQMNVYDSGRMVDILAPLGYTLTDQPAEADLMVLNTCHIREKATEKVFSDLGRLRPHKDKLRDSGLPMIAVTGCTAQAEGQEILRRAPYVDLVVGPQSYHELPELIARVHRARAAHEKGPGRGIVATDFPVESKFDHLPSVTSQGPSAFVAIQEGCDKFCHFCCVPYTRGAEYSRSAQEIRDEVIQLVDQGAREITLLGQNVNGYHGQGLDGKEWTLGRLLYDLADIPGLWRLRYTTSHPMDVEDTLIEAHRDLDKLMPLLHLPVQSGSDRILKAMNRKHTIETYLTLIDRFQKARSSMAFTSDFIVGYPGETEEDFRETLNLVNTVGFSLCYSFHYSPRPGTPGAAMTNQVPEAVKKERLERLQACTQEHQRRFNQSFAGQTVPVLVEKKGRKPGQMIGRSPHMQSVYFQGSERLLGQIVDVTVRNGHLNSLEGDMVIMDEALTCH